MATLEGPTQGHGDIQGHMGPRDTQTQRHVGPHGEGATKTQKGVTGAGTKRQAHQRSGRRPSAASFSPKTGRAEEGLVTLPPKAKQWGLW